MIILSKKMFSREPIDISHLSPAAQKAIISKERKKIELDQKISDTAASIRENKQRASMSIAENAQIGAKKMQRNQLAATGSSIGGMMLGEKALKAATSLVPGLEGVGSGIVGSTVSRMVGSSLGNAISGAAGRVVGAVKGLTAGMTARRKEKKLMRLAKKRAKLGE